LSTPRFFQSLLLQRPTIDEGGDEVLPSGTLVSGSVWDRRRKAIVGGTGELLTVTAQGFFPKTTDLQRRDFLTISAGPQAGTRYEVLEVVSAYDDRGSLSHVGAELRDI